MKKGVSLISLIITIVVIIILASFTYFSSLNTIDETILAKKQSELEDVYTFVREISAKAQAGLIDLNLTSATLADDSILNDFYVSGDGTQLTEDKKESIESFNDSIKEEDRPELGYHYITGRQIEFDTIPGLEGISTSNGGLITPNKVENDYIINFYYGTVIAKVSSDKTLVRGKIVSDSSVNNQTDDSDLAKLREYFVGKNFEDFGTYYSESYGSYYDLPFKNMEPILNASTSIEMLDFSYDYITYNNNNKIYKLVWNDDTVVGVTLTDINRDIAGLYDNGNVLVTPYKEVLTGVESGTYLNPNTGEYFEGYKHINSYYDLSGNYVFSESAPVAQKGQPFSCELAT